MKQNQIKEMVKADPVRSVQGPKWSKVPNLITGATLLSSEFKLISRTLEK